MPAAPESTDDVREEVHATLAKIREKGKTCRLGDGSRLSRVKHKLNGNGTVADEE